MFHVTTGDTIELSDDRASSAVSLVPARGGIVTRFRVGGRELLYLDETTLGDPTKNVRGGIPLLFPSPGKLEGGRFSRAGKQGAMKQHGFARDLAWKLAADTQTHDGAAMTLTLASNEATRAMYPWDFALALTVTLRAERLRIDLRVTNTGDASMPYAFGIHPYFLVTDKAHTRIATRATRAFDNVTKKTEPFVGFDLTAREVDLHLIDHGSTDSTLTYANSERLAIRASSEFTRWVVWTVEGKDFVCVEPWTAPGDALNSGESLQELRPGASQELWIELEHLPAASA